MGSCPGRASPRSRLPTCSPGRRWASRTVTPSCWSWPNPCSGRPWSGSSRRAASWSSCRSRGSPISASRTVIGRLSRRPWPPRAAMPERESCSPFTSATPAPTCRGSSACRWMPWASTWSRPTSPSSDQAGRWDWSLAEADYEEARHWGERLQVPDYPKLVELLRQSPLNREQKHEVQRWSSRYAVRLLESAGLDVVYDGEQQRTEMYDWTVKHSLGFE